MWTALHTLQHCSSSRSSIYLYRIELEQACRFLAEVKRIKLQYFGHVVRADNLCTYVLHGIVVGKRRRGRPRRRWTDDIKQWTGISVAECIQHAKDRSAWRALVSVSVTSDPQLWQDKTIENCDVTSHTS